MRVVGVTGKTYHSFDQWIKDTVKQHCFYDAPDDDPHVIHARSERHEELGYWNSDHNRGVIFDQPLCEEWELEDYDHLTGEL